MESVTSAFALHATIAKNTWAGERPRRLEQELKALAAIQQTQDRRRDRTMGSPASAARLKRRTSESPLPCPG